MIFRAKSNGERQISGHFCTGLQCIVLILAVLIANNPFSGFAGKAEQPIASSFVLPGFPPPLIPESERVEDEYFEGAILIGDSISEGMRLNNSIPELNIIAKIGQSPQGVVRMQTYKHNGKSVRMVDILADERPEVLYIWLGANGLDYNPSDRVIADYQIMLDQFISELPDSLIICLAVAPVIESQVQKHYPNMTNGRINMFNTKLEALVLERNCYFLNTPEVLKDSYGSLKKEYSAPDGLHMSKAGYQAVSDYLYTHALPVKGD